MKAAFQKNRNINLLFILYCFILFYNHYNTSDKLPNRLLCHFIVYCYMRPKAFVRIQSDPQQ